MHCCGEYSCCCHFIGCHLPKRNKPLSLGGKQLTEADAQRIVQSFCAPESSGRSARSSSTPGLGWERLCIALCSLRSRDGSMAGLVSPWEQRRVQRTGRADRHREQSHWKKTVQAHPNPVKPPSARAAASAAGRQAAGKSLHPNQGVFRLGQGTSLLFMTSQNVGYFIFCKRADRSVLESTCWSFCGSASRALSRVALCESIFA